jgi:hypothetical protein
LDMVASLSLMPGPRAQPAPTHRCHKAISVAERIRRRTIAPDEEQQSFEVGREVGSGRGAGREGRRGGLFEKG